MAAFTHLTCFKKLCEKIYFKKYCFMEQGFYELETEEAKMGSNSTMVETADTLVIESLFLAVHPSPLANLFFLDFSFF